MTSDGGAATAEPGGEPDLPALDTARSRRLPAAVKPILIVVASVVVGLLVLRFVGAVDWPQVAGAFRQLSPWQVVPLAVLLMVRQTLNAVPLHQFVAGLTLGRSMQNDLGANLAGTIAPPPADVVVRVAMFNSWNVNPLDGMAGVTLNMLTFYSVRLLAPAVGLVLLAVAGYEAGNVLLAVVLALVAVALIVALLLLLRAERWAALVGRTAARVAGRFKGDVDSDVWSRAVVDFRGRMTANLPPRLAASMVALLGMVLVDATILVLALRFAGVDSSSISLVYVVGSFLTAYPLTIMPLAGFGVLDAALLAALTAAAGLAAEPAILAALTIWRATTLLGTLVIGAVVTLVWRRRSRSTSTRAADSAQQQG